MSTIACDLFPDLLTRGVLALYPNGQRVTVLYAGEPVSVYNGASDRREEPPRSALHLDLDHPLGRARLAHVLAAGLACPACEGKRRVTYNNVAERLRECGLNPPADMTGDCEPCSGTGYLRRPSDVRHLLPVAELGTLPDEHAQHSPALLAWHAEDVGRGGRGVVGVYGPREMHPRHPAYYRRTLLSGVGEPEIAPHMEEADARDAEKLASGYTLLSNTPDTPLLLPSRSAT